MRTGIRLGRIFGINVDIDWSWFFILLLVTWNLAAAILPALHPDWGFGLNLIVAVVASLLFFLSVLLHELAHSLVARARGLPVRNITLFIFGGVSNIEREPPSPGTEFLVSIVGPITSLVLGVLFLFLGGAIATGSQMIQDVPGTLAQLGPLSTILLWLGPINIILGIFNLIPGFPLDGGRVVRSIFWQLTGNLRQATRWATWIGQGIAWLFIITGIAMAFGVEIPFLGSGFVSGLWLAFIGWFLNNAAVQSYRQVVVGDLLDGVPVQRVMRAQVPVVPPNIPVSRLVDEYLMGTDERAFPVMDEGRGLAGMVCLEDIRKIPRDQWENIRVAEIMTPASKLEQVTPNEDVSTALNKLAQRDVRQMPVVQNGQLVGMLRRRDILRWLQIHSDLESS
jgi:Zn-dependent protease/CBS domain-containing protein